MNCCVSFCMPSLSPPNDLISLSADDACLSARSGDIILFSGTSYNSILIEMVCPSLWSHIGIIIEDLKNPGDPLVFESVERSEGYINALTNKENSGVRVVRLRRYLERYEGNAIAIRYLQMKKNDPARKIIHNTLTKMCQNLNQLSYEKRIFEFINSKFRFWSNSKKTPDSYFCSELVAQAYIDIGLLSSDISANCFLPSDFGESGGIVLKSPQNLHAGEIKLSNENYIALKDSPVYKCNRNLNSITSQIGSKLNISNKIIPNNQHSLLIGQSNYNININNNNNNIIKNKNNIGNNKDYYYNHNFNNK